MKTSLCRVRLFLRLCPLLAAIVWFAAQPVQGASLIMGGLTREVYTNVPGVGVADLTNAAKFPSQPDLVQVMTSFETPFDSGDNYGDRLSGALLPPVTGVYIFYLAADDQAVLYLSPDTEASHKVAIAREDTWSSPRSWTEIVAGRTNQANISAPIYLEAGKAYYVETLHKEGGGGDHIGVAWQLPGELPPPNMSPPIGGEYLARFGNEISSVVVTTADSGPGSLRDVVAGAAPGATITFAVSGAVTLTTGPITIGKSLTISGPGAQALAIERSSALGTPSFRIFDVMSGSLSISDLTIRGGNVAVSNGSEFGAGILNRGSLVLNRCVFSGNDAPGEYSRGGAICILMEGSVAANACTFMRNRASGRNGEAGAIYNYGYLALTNCTFNGNYAGGWGGAVHNDMLSRGVSINSCTFMDNEGSSGGAVFNRGAPPINISPVWVRNSIFVGNRPEDIGHSSVIRSGGYNLIGTFYEMIWDAPQYHFVPQAGDRTNVTAMELKLGPLALNGGPTPTQAPLRHSPAIDNGPTDGFPPLDQRGLARPFGMRCDIGAVESDQVFPNQAPTIACPGRTEWQATTPQGATGTLTVSVADADADELVVAWSADGAVCQTNRVPGTASTNANVSLTLTLPVGQHVVVASVSDGPAAAACSTEISVLPPPPPPLITQPPLSQTRFSGQVVSFSVRAEGGSALSYQWRFNNGPIAGATDSSYALEATKSGVFSVVVGDASRTVTSPPARLTILPRPTGPGSLDVTFDPTLMNQLSGLTEGQGTVYCLARQSDGKVIAGGSFTAVGNRPRNCLVRLNRNGTVDETFNAGYGVDGPVRGIGLLREGRILIVGDFSTVNGAPRNGIARLYSDGTVDADFNPSVQGSTPVCVYVQPDGKLLIGGSFTNVCGVMRKGVARLNLEGTLDTSFDAGAVVRSDGASVSALAVDAEGRVLIAGHFTPGAYDRPLARLTANGSADPGFLVPIIREQSNIGWVFSLALDREGRILLGGRFWAVNGVNRPGVARLLPTGMLDSSFASGAIDQKSVNKVAVIGGKVLIGGNFTSVDGVARSGLARLNADGSLDGTFDAGTAVSANTPPWINDLIAETNVVLVAAGLPSNYEPQSPHPLCQLLAEGQLDQQYKIPDISHQAAVMRMAVQPDGRVLALATDSTFVNGIPTGPLVRLLPNGTRDPNFVRTIRTGRCSCIALHPDGKILLGGEHFIMSNGTLLRGIIRLNPDGTLDPNFVTEGGDYHLWVSGMVLQPDGRIIVIGEFDTIRGGQRSYMARLNANGSFDDSFRLDPALVVTAGEFDPPLNCVAVQPDGKILLGGWFNDIEPRLVRLNPDGSLDRELSGSGWAASVDFLAQQPDGKILVGGRFNTPEPNRECTVVRINPDGAVDTFFDSAFNHITGLVLQPDGKVLVGVGAGAEALVRCLPNGQRDPAFVSNLRSGPGPAYFQSLVLQPDGQILVAGALTTADGIPWNGIARLNNIIERPRLWVTRQLPGQHAPPGPTVRLVALPVASVAVYALEEQPPANWFVTNISHGGVFDRATGKVKFGPYYDHDARTLTYNVFPPLGYQGVGRFVGTASADGVGSSIAGDDTWVIAGPHPADIRERDWRLTMDEVTAYGAAWRTGGVWTFEPNPIPMTYVTRAAALWRGGESYTVDPRIATPPLWWVNSLGPILPQPQLALGSGGTAQRSLPGGFLASEPVATTLALEPPTGTRGYAVEESLPAGARLLSISEGGTLDTAQNRIKWGPFLDDLPRVLHYRVALAQPQGGMLQFEGTASFDGELMPILGPDQLRSTSQLSWGSLPQNGQWNLQLRGDLGAVYEIQSSADLARWTTLTRVTNTTGSVEIPITKVPGTSQLFYRATLVVP